MSESDGFGEAWADLYFSATRAAQKMLVVYRESQPDALPGECWAETEALVDALERVAQVTGYSVRDDA